jgi:hypothetical protein
MLRPILEGLAQMFVDDMFKATSIRHKRTKQEASPAWTRLGCKGHDGVGKNSHPTPGSADDVRVLMEPAQSHTSLLYHRYRGNGPSGRHRKGCLLHITVLNPALHWTTTACGGNHHAQPQTLMEHARCDIIMWRSYLCLFRMDTATCPETWSRSNLESFGTHRV